VNDVAQVQLSDVFVEMADTLVDDFDVLDFLHVLADRCVQLLGVSAAGLLVTGRGDALQVVAASSERTRLLELFQLQTDQGPAVDCFRTGRAVSVVDLRASGHHWPRFTTAAAGVGFTAVHALPMRLRTDIVGALSLFDAGSDVLDEGRVRIAQALADVATIGLLQQRAIHDRGLLTEQLQTALHSRVLIEQAKGVLAERFQLDMGEAFTMLRSNARRQRRRLSDLAQAIVAGSEQLPPEHAGSDLSAGANNPARE
jgi:transcriptional regulator with GAF, ATPase, and Fis domain